MSSDSPVLATQPLTLPRTQRPEMLDRFTRDMVGGELRLVHDQGLYRHITFRPSKGNFCWFDIITTPGQLTIRGDMGDYMFAREPDMLRDFFHRNVNPGYWKEKLIAQDVQSPAWDYSYDVFRGEVLKQFWEKRRDFHTAGAKELWEEIRDVGPLSDWTDNQHVAGARAALEDFTSDVAPGFRFDLDDEDDFHDYGFQYLWCCHAVLWAASAYRAHHRAVAS